MKRKLGSLILLTAVFSLTAIVASASGSLPGSGWWTSESVQNVGTSTANVSATAYSSSSVSTYVTSTSVISGWATTILPSDFSGMPSGFSGSAVVSADQPIVAVGYVTNRLSGSNGVSGGKAAGRFQGMLSPNTPLYFPLVKHNWYGHTTLFYIQNAGSTSTTAQAVFAMGNNLTYTYTTPSLGANQMIVVSPADAGVPNTGGTATYANIGSLTVSSAQVLAGSYAEYLVGETVATVLNTTRAFSSADFSTKAYAPVVKRNWFGRLTGIQVLNVSSGPITATVTYKGTGGTSCIGNSYVDTATNVAPGKSYTFVQMAGSTNLPDACLASGTITGTNNFVAIVNENNASGYPLAGAVYSAMADSTVTSKLAIPYFTDRRGGFSTGFQIQNVGAVTDSTVVATFYCRGDPGGNTPFTAVSNPVTIAAGSAYLFLKPNTMPAGTFTSGMPFSSQNALCSAIVTGTQPLVGIVNETPTAAGTVDDANYEAFDLTP